MPKKHVTNTVLNQQMHACVSAQSDQGLWVFTVETRFTWNKGRSRRKHMANKVSDLHVHVHPHSLSTEDLWNKKKKQSSRHTTSKWRRINACNYVGDVGTNGIKLMASTDDTILKSIGLRGMFEMNCLFLSGDFKFQVSPKVLISCPRSTPRG